MEQAQTAPQIIVIVGQTASGKSAAAMDLAQRINGEIICADSRTIYKYMNIGTAKPTAADQALIPHHGLDLIAPDQTYSAAAFQKYAQQKVYEIDQRGRVPIIVGGTGLYIDGFVYSYTFGDRPNPKLRIELEGMTLEQLQARAVSLGIEPSANARHLGRTIERHGQVIERAALPKNIKLYGMQIDQETLHARISERVDTMFTNGFVDEVQNVINLFGADAPGMLAPGYKAVRQYLQGDITEAKAKELFVKGDKQLAKRQRTWFKRNTDIQWVSTLDGASWSRFGTIE